jgi:hypothetical protein
MDNVTPIEDGLITIKITENERAFLVVFLKVQLLELQSNCELPDAVNACEKLLNKIEVSK